MTAEARPICRCGCGEPMHRAGTTSTGRAKWRCPVRDREYVVRKYAEDAGYRERKAERNSRKIEMSAGGISFYVGTVPTAEAAELIRAKIRDEAPRADRRREAEASA